MDFDKGVGQLVVEKLIKSLSKSESIEEGETYEMTMEANVKVLRILEDTDDHNKYPSRNIISLNGINLLIDTNSKWEFTGGHKLNYTKVEVLAPTKESE